MTIYNDVLVLIGNQRECHDDRPPPQHNVCKTMHIMQQY